MAEYIVTRKSDGAEVYRYQSEAPVEWNGMEFSTHDHVTVAQQPVTPTGARLSACLGLWPSAERPAVIPLREDGAGLVAARAARRRREDDDLLVMVLL